MKFLVSLEDSPPHRLGDPIREVEESPPARCTQVTSCTVRLNSMFLNYEQVTEEIKREIKNFLETNPNENTTTQNLWDAAEAVLRETFIAAQSCLGNKRNIEQTT